MTNTEIDMEMLTNTQHNQNFFFYVSVDKPGQHNTARKKNVFHVSEPGAWEYLLVCFPCTTLSYKHTPGNFPTPALILLYCQLSFIVERLSKARTLMVEAMSACRQSAPQCALCHRFSPTHIGIAWDQICAWFIQVLSFLFF